MCTYTCNARMSTIIHMYDTITISTCVHVYVYMYVCTNVYMHTSNVNSSQIAVYTHICEYMLRCVREHAVHPAPGK